MKKFHKVFLVYMAGGLLVKGIQNKALDVGDFFNEVYFSTIVIVAFSLIFLAVDGVNRHVKTVFWYCFLTAVVLLTSMIVYMMALHLTYGQSWMAVRKAYLIVGLVLVVYFGYGRMQGRIE